ncbi:MAG: hypothetical protein HN403_13835, partial [Rhodospirillales bacterium]|nr:hypothetical protein [Rhodospirillales bacterium]
TQRVGVELEIRRVPWRRAVKMLEIDQADALFPASFKKERTALGVYPMKDGKPDDSRKIAEYSYYAYTTKDSGISLDGNQIKNADCPIGAMRLSAIIEQLKNTGHQVNEEETSRINLRKLLQGRICALVDLDFVIDPFLTSNPSLGSGIRKLSPAIRTKPYFLLFTKTFVKKWPVRTEQIWDAIGEFRRSPAFEDLRKKYGLL